MLRSLVAGTLTGLLSTAAAMAQIPPALPTFSSPTEGSMLVNVSVRWGVQACNAVNCSALGGTRTLNVPGAASTTRGPVLPSSHAQALGKVYVLPGNSSASGLHWKAQQSTAPAFASSRTIDGQTKPLREWIRIWIDQGAQP